MDDVTAVQQSVCRGRGVAYVPPAPGSRLGVALQTLDRLPINGLRIAGSEAASGWYLWGGEETSEDPNFYQPLCIEHVAGRCPLALNFLGLPPGWRFLTDGKYVDVWFDPDLLEPSRTWPDE